MVRYGSQQRECVVWPRDSRLALYGSYCTVQIAWTGLSPKLTAGGITDHRLCWRIRSVALLHNASYSCTICGLPVTNCSSPGCPPERNKLITSIAGAGLAEPNTSSPGRTVLNDQAAYCGVMGPCVRLLGSARRSGRAGKYKSRMGERGAKNSVIGAAVEVEMPNAHEKSLRKKGLNVG